MQIAFVVPLLLSGSLVGCAGPGLPDPCSLFGRPKPIDRNCLSIAAVERYLTGVRDEVLAAYQPPDRPLEGAYVEFHYTLERDGSVRNRCVMRASERLVAESLLAAFDAAAPFPPLPRYAQCIAGAEIVRHVHTPSTRPRER